MPAFYKILLAFMGGWFICFGMVRGYFKAKYSSESGGAHGILKVAYDQDDPSHPAMGLEIESLDYILSHDSLTLVIQKYNFPDTKRPVYLQNSKDKSA